ncbi:hypothetical protein NN3_01440 [Nocardia neocaledoniensis NBRC 108232]|uniref:4-coumarate--CoA ligase family protein n=1 Tax=Nocardia neocaledoniensis TaxID=236511 RepID=UPI0011907E59|nr:4-coumarate--CoA ligase family protein [Nocardia neocaledoniensis]GEM29137.1 hypothetical protein NN3_01440 [Nocardia neocaledoniensis NBRC 108232]
MSLAKSTSPPGQRAAATASTEAGEAARADAATSTRPRDTRCGRVDLGVRQDGREREQEPGFRKIRHVSFVDAILKSVTGKILRRELRQREAGH